LGVLPALRRAARRPRCPAASSHPTPPPQELRLRGVEQLLWDARRAAAAAAAEEARADGALS
jgi:hypothetical protein